MEGGGWGKNHHIFPGAVFHLIFKMVAGAKFLAKFEMLSFDGTQFKRLFGIAPFLTLLLPSRSFGRYEIKWFIHC